VTVSTARQAALAVLWVQVAGLVIGGSYLAFEVAGPARWIFLADTVLVSASIGLWAALLGGYLRGVRLPENTPLLVAFRLIFPWLIALRAALWLLQTLSILGGAGDTSNPIAVILLFLTSGTGLVANLAIFAISSLLFVQPENPLGRARLLTWLNISAMVAVAITIMNIWPPTGFAATPSLIDRAIYAVGGVLDLSATLLLMRAVRLVPGGRGEGSRE
jgi:hypothetical protein